MPVVPQSRRFGLVLAAVVAALLSPAGPAARAAAIGTITVAPASGDGATVMSLVTAGPCLHGSMFQVFVTGSGFPAEGFAVTDAVATDALPAAATGGYGVPLAGSMDSFVAAQPLAVDLAGTYTFTGRCTDSPGGPALDTYEGGVVFTPAAGASATYVAKVAVQLGYVTATALSASPSGPVSAGTQVTFTAHVSSSPPGGAVGSVQLEDGGVAVGEPTPVDAAGNATITVALTASGEHSLTAGFTGSGLVGSSTSSVLVLTVNGTPADATTTSLSLSPSDASTGDTVSFTATVADTAYAAKTPHGTVQFTDGGAPLGAPVAVDTSGRAAFARALAPGTHRLAAAFVATDPLAFLPSSSAAEPYTVRRAAGGGQDLATTVDPGALTISVADGSTVLLAVPQLNADATFLTSTGELLPVTVTDTRAGSPGWVVSGQLSDFVDTTQAGSTTIPASDLGWTPRVIDQSPGQVVAAGHAVRAADPPVVLDLPASNGNGLAASRPLGGAAAGHGTGTARLGASLELDVPTSVQAGTYVATLTLTAI